MTQFTVVVVVEQLNALFLQRFTRCVQTFGKFVHGGFIAVVEPVHPGNDNVLGSKTFGFLGNGEGAKPAQAEAAGARTDALDATITWKHIELAQGCNVRYGVAPDKLYLSWLVYDADEVTLSTLTAGQEDYVCVDSFNENGITPGKTFKLEG